MTFKLKRMNHETLKMEYDNTFRDYKALKGKIPITNYTFSHTGVLPICDISIYISDHKYSLEFRDAIRSYLRPILSPKESVVCWLSCRNQRVGIVASCTTIFQHPQLVNKQLEDRLVYLFSNL